MSHIIRVTLSFTGELAHAIKLLHSLFNGVLWGPPFVQFTIEQIEEVEQEKQEAQALVEYALIIALLTFIGYFALWWIGIDVSIVLNEVRHTLLGYE